MATIDKSIGAYHDSSSARIRKIGGYSGPAAYVTGGDPITAADLGMARLELMLFSGATNGTLYRTLVFIPTGTTGNGTVRWLDATNGTEVGAGANLSAYSARFEAVGK
ncbi:MAG TPA: hypothetical protein VIX41_07600 [Acidimicrobiales bacterium]